MHRRPNDPTRREPHHRYVNISDESKILDIIALELRPPLVFVETERARSGYIMSNISIYCNKNTSDTYIINEKFSICIGVALVYKHKCIYNGG